MSISVEEKAFKGTPNRVINYEGGKIVSNDEGIAFAKTYGDVEKLIAYGFIQVEGAKEDYVGNKQEVEEVEEIVENLREVNEEISYVCNKSVSFIDFIIELVRKFFK